VSISPDRGAGQALPLSAGIEIAPFRWRDGERLMIFGRGALAEVDELLRPGYVLLTTPRGRDAAAALIDRAGAVHEVGAGRVDELAGALRSRIDGSLLVALGGGRVIDVAKAVAAADPPRIVAAIPTTLSGAEMTVIHRHAAGVAADTPRVRPAIVVSDPALSASAPPQLLAQSAGNALGHAVEGPTTPLRNPVGTLAALAAARLLDAGFATASPDDRARDALALGALLAGYAIGSSGYGLHHVVSQTLARFAGVGHGAANTIMLPQTVPALAHRAPAWHAELEHALGHDPAELATRLREFSGTVTLRDAGVSEEDLETCALEAAKRAELEMTPPRADLEELRELYRAAY
jgi:alcohol dehydrogenase class IV